jgi:predicted ATPase
MDFLRKSLEHFDVFYENNGCCDDICMACQKWCESCFNTYINLYDNKEDLISTAIEWEFVPGIKKILQSSYVDANKINEFTHISLFEKVCMIGNEECVRVFLEYTNFLNSNSGLSSVNELGISILISKPSVLTIIQSFLDATDMIKEPSVE